MSRMRGTKKIKEQQLAILAEEYKDALTRIEEIFHSKPDTPESDEMELLGILIKKYEDEKYN